MGGISYGSTAWSSKDPVQESIDTLNAAIDRLDKIINEMGQNNGTTN